MYNTLAALPGVRRELRGLLWRGQGGRKPLIAREICAAVVVEAWRLIHDDDELKSDTDDPTPTSDPTPPPPVIHLALGQAMINQGRSQAAQMPWVGPRSGRVQQACNEYWLACGGKEIGETGDIENWRRPLERALRSDHSWIRSRLLAVQNPTCQSAPERDPRSASKRDPFERRVLAVALAPSELVGVAETGRARVVGA